MRTPVIIPAFNEELRLGATLESLPRDLVEPIVVVNGSNDGTTRVAESFGVNVQEIEQQGKMPAIQNALSYLGSRALDPLLILDADARPIFPRRWHYNMTEPLHGDMTPVVVGGPIWYIGQPRAEAFLRSLYRAGRTLARNRDGSMNSAIQFGPNMAVRINDKDVLEKVMSIPNYWPGEDRAIGHEISAGRGRYLDILHPYATAWNPTSISAISLADRLRLGRDDSLAIVAERYVARGPQDSTAFK